MEHDNWLCWLTDFVIHFIREIVQLAFDATQNLAD